MDLIEIYRGLGDRTRLRILHLLMQTPLCGCHFQEILQEPQVKISKHLGYLRKRKMVSTDREQNWIIYSLPKPADPELERNLKCLHDCVHTDPVFRRDLKKLFALRKSCCEPTLLFSGAANSRKRNGKTKSSVHLRS